MTPASDKCHFKRIQMFDRNTLNIRTFIQIINGLFFYSLSVECLIGDAIYFAACHSNPAAHTERGDAHWLILVPQLQEAAITFSKGALLTDTLLTFA